MGGWGGCIDPRFLYLSTSWRWVVSFTLLLLIVLFWKMDAFPPTGINGVTYIPEDASRSSFQNVASKTTDNVQHNIYTQHMTNCSEHINHKLSYIHKQCSHLKHNTYRYSQNFGVHLHSSPVTEQSVSDILIDWVVCWGLHTYSPRCLKCSHVHCSLSLCKCASMQWKQPAPPAKRKV
jgi:hypothetical protein